MTNKLTKILIMVLVMIMSTQTMVFASNGLPFEISEMKIGLVKDGEIITWDEEDLGSLFLAGNVTMTPLRQVANTLNYDVKWLPETQEVLVTKGDESVTFKIGAYKVNTTNGIVELRQPIVVIEGRTYLEIRGISEIFGYHVDWKSFKNVEGGRNFDKDNYVVITSPEGQKAIQESTVDFTENAILDGIEAKYPTWSQVHNENVYVFSNVPSDLRNGYLTMRNRVADGSISIDIKGGWGEPKVQEAFLSLLEVATGSSVDAKIIYDEWLSTIENNGETEAEDTWVKAGGSQFMITNEGVHTGVRFLIK